MKIMFERSSDQLLLSREEMLWLRGTRLKGTAMLIKIMISNTVTRGQQKSLYASKGNHG